MAYLDPNRYPCWKGSLRDGVIDPAFAKTVGEVIGKIHARTAKNGDVAAAFPNQALFEVLRMEPYLRSTATRHPDFAGRLNELADTTLATRLALMHGDVSPKNILQGPDGPVFLDSEGACYGDPAFDLAFCLNHLLLKSVWRPQWRDCYMQCFESLFAGYGDQIDWERPADLEARAAGLLSALLLARIDGKSPVEYITTDAQKANVRRISRRLIAEPADTLGEIRDAWYEGITE